MNSHPTLVRRQSHLNHLVGALYQGACSAVVGLSNTGKSTLLRMLADPEVQRQYLPAGAVLPLVIYVDCNYMLELSEQGFYEAMLRVALGELREAGADAGLIEHVAGLYQRIIEPSSHFVLPLSFSEGITQICERSGRRVVFLLDEFDQPFSHLEGRIFLNLRALRDCYGTDLVYVTATEQPLDRLRSDTETSEFQELFAGRVHWLGTLTAPEVRSLLMVLGTEAGVRLDEAEVQFVLAQTGGHPGLVTAVANVLIDLEAGTPGLYREQGLALVQGRLEDSDTVRAECAKLWRQLSAVQQETLTDLVRGGQPASEAGHELLVRQAILDAEGSIFGSLFRGFVQRQDRVRNAVPPGIWIDVDAGEAWVEGRQLATLTDLEYRLLLLLYGRMDKLCDKYQIVESVWGEQYIDSVDDARIEKLVSRLRTKLESDPSNPRYLLTVRGRGYRLQSRPNAPE